MSRRLQNFFSGIGSVFTLSPPQHAEIPFFFRGRNLATLTTEEALRQDWEHVGKSLFGAIEQIDNDAKRAAERSPGE
jgi:hypothetical protein